ncbi:EAL domain-containing protein [Glaciecola siphonariae]|uniref:EAL domain-containing protein n=1 Tax=Glaciecola siphonariae TaxID=521012 RepID=A0ABV9LWP9_9ALTE
MQALVAPPNVTLEQIVPFYQPIFTLADHRVYRYECLARLLDTKQQVILPNEFLYIVESNHEAADMTGRILELSRAYCKPRQMSWSINLFASDLDDLSLLQSIREMCSDSSKGLCGIEINFACIKDKLVQLRSLLKSIPNLHITIDEVDQCCDSLYALVASGIDAIKIKAEFIKEYAKTEAGKSAIDELKDLCEQQNCKLIAEHIEDEQSLKAVTEMNILYGQGFYLSHPSPRVYPIHSA